jgi:serine-type D-Ala-D-Ala carboxypeptidase (penicillin-binding protein 5/6)
VKKLTALLLILMALLICSPAALALEIDASSAVLIDAVTGRLLFEQNSHQALPPASTTKILTAMLALESASDLDAIVTLPDDFVNVGESGIYLEPGETQTMRDLLYALMLRSANDAAQAIAIAVSGSEAAFVELMNERTAELGLSDSHWSNSHGLDAADHLASAYDLALITRQALTSPFFNELIVTKSWVLPWSGNGYDRVLYNHNQFLDYYTGADGVKTGYTELAGNCLVASASREGMRLIGVVLNCPEQTHYEAMTQLMDYGFENFQPLLISEAGKALGKVKVNQGDSREVEAVLAHDLVIAVPNGSTFSTDLKIDLPASVTAPLDPTVAIGSVSFSDDQGNKTEVPLYPKESVERYTFGTVFKAVWQRFIAVLL